MSQTIWTNRSPCPDKSPFPPFPTSQNPNLATRVPEHIASVQPHQYVTPSTPQTGLVRKQLTGQETGAVDLGQMVSLSSVGSRIVEEEKSESDSDRTAEDKRENTRKRRRKRRLLEEDIVAGCGERRAGRRSPLSQRTEAILAEDGSFQLFLVERLTESSRPLPADGNWVLPRLSQARHRQGF